MQISSGWAKGMSLAVPAGLATRPTAAKVRAAILNALAPVLDGALVLDVFAGSGALGIEAVSRGARGAVFVEQASAAVTCLKKNLIELERRALKQGLEVPELEVLARSADAAMARAQSLGPFDVLCMDPPYKEAEAWLEKLAGPLAAAAAEEALLVVEAGAVDLGALAATIPGFPWRLRREKHYGETTVTVWEKADGGEEEGAEDTGSATGEDTGP